MTTHLPQAEARAKALLDWYDRHRRDLPWRAGDGEAADPYAVWLSEIMLQQTTVKAVAPYYGAFLARWPTVHALAAAPLDDVLKAWAGLGYYSRARNLHACAREIETRCAGVFPQDESLLKTLPGIGDYTAAAIAAIAFGRPAAVVDGNVERVVTRLGRIDTPLPQARVEIKAMLQAMLPAGRPGDFAQALMDLGATLCTPKNPSCCLCPWRDPCQAHAAGDQHRFPVKRPKRPARPRGGAAFVISRPDGAVLVRQRPDRGLLAKMLEVPNSPWQEGPGAGQDLDHAPLTGLNYQPMGLVRHVFTHFPLELRVYAAEVPVDTGAPAAMRWCAAADLDGEAFPNLFRKVLAQAGITSRRARP